MAATADRVDGSAAVTERGGAFVGQVRRPADMRASHAVGIARTCRAEGTFGAGCACSAGLAVASEYGYRDTFVAARLWIDNARWRGVPFYLRTGKRLAATKQRVSLILREPAGPLAGQLPRAANVLSFWLAGDGEIDLSLVAKSPARRWTSTPRTPRSRCPAWTARIPCRPMSG